MKEIIITIDDKTGEVEIETKGFTGNECLLETKELKESLGIVKNEKKTAEFYKRTVKQINKNRRGYWDNHTA